MIYGSCLSSLVTTLLVHVHAEDFFALKVSEDICAHAGLGQTDGDMHAFYGRKEYTLAPKSKAKDTDGEAALLARLRKAQNDYDLLSPQPMAPETVLIKPKVGSMKGMKSGLTDLTMLRNHLKSFEIISQPHAHVPPQVLERLAQQVKELPARKAPVIVAGAAEEPPPPTSPREAVPPTPQLDTAAAHHQDEDEAGVQLVSLKELVDALKQELDVETPKLGAALTEVMETLFGEDDKTLGAKRKANKCAEECGLAMRAK